MSTFFFFGKYDVAALKGVSAARTKKAENLIKKCGGKLNCMYALLGGCDLVLVVELPSVEAAVKASVTLAKQTGISFTTAPAVEVKSFDKLAGRS